MKTIRIYWELTAIMAIISIALNYEKKFFISTGLYLPLLIFANVIFAYSLISVYVAWRKK